MEQRQHYRIAGWSCIAIAVLALVFLFFIEKNSVFVLLALVGGGGGAAYLLVLVPSTYKEKHRLHYKKWHVIHGFMDEHLEIEFDDRKTPLN